MGQAIQKPEETTNVRLLSRKQVAEILGVTTETIKRMGKDGRLHEIVISRNIVRYHPDDVARYTAVAA